MPLGIVSLACRYTVKGRECVQCLECRFDIRQFKEDGPVWDLLVVQDESDAPDNW